MEGILALYKPEGLTSHDCIDKLRKLTGMRRIGHTGTLDPGVSGVLPICIGKATKVAQYMSDYSKTYEGEIKLGTATTTEDAFGETVAEKVVDRPITREEIETVFQRFTGTIGQVPPMYSAVKVKGRRLYEYAREGIKVDRPKRQVTVYELKLLDERNQFHGGQNSVSFRARCSKGTYIRTLAVDIGKMLGFPAHMASLIRTASGPFTLTDCLTFEEIEENIAGQTLEHRLFPLDKALSSFEKVVVGEDLATKIKNGSVLPLSAGMEENRFTVYNEEGTFLAIYQQHPTKQGMMKPEKVFNT
jgi:tRNA pseudouridine55 synthase